MTKKTSNKIKWINFIWQEKERKQKLKLQEKESKSSSNFHQLPRSKSQNFQSISKSKNLLPLSNRVAHTQMYRWSYTNLFGFCVDALQMREFRVHSVICFSECPLNIADCAIQQWFQKRVDVDEGGIMSLISYDFRRKQHDRGVFVFVSEIKYMKKPYNMHISITVEHCQ